MTWLRGWGIVAMMAAASPALAQTATEHIALGDRAADSLDAKGALAHYTQAIQADSNSYEALWKATKVAVDLAEFDTDKDEKSQLLTTAQRSARRAVTVRPNDAEGHFHLARALGIGALSVGVRDRVKFAKEVRAQALEALRLDPRHPGAMHVLGEWNAEIMRLSGFERLFAKSFLGGGVFGEASWEQAVKYMEESVAIDPTRPVHHLGLARIYRDTKAAAKAREQYEATISGRAREYNDRRYQQQATDELRTLK